MTATPPPCSSSKRTSTCPLTRAHARGNKTQAWLANKAHNTRDHGEHAHSGGTKSTCRERKGKQGSKSDGEVRMISSRQFEETSYAEVAREKGDEGSDGFSPWLEQVVTAATTRVAVPTDL
ncbi:hypothetical protein PR202_ga22148 [Eleusine coracana subsp. coracana]|uniref:Uncharacterized protein n=1 Tax=Eleusine coracana subsp. coracana TaxID=191504 RepID=A0AAV5D3I2_ELECO|nr:hypothetical protein PR202_ga22148 [Eleusine coracana subsp. coracana]